MTENVMSNRKIIKNGVLIEVTKISKMTFCQGFEGCHKKIKKGN